MVQFSSHNSVHQKLAGWRALFSFEIRKPNISTSISSSSANYNGLYIGLIFIDSYHCIWQVRTIFLWGIILLFFPNGIAPFLVMNLVHLTRILFFILSSLYNMFTAFLLKNKLFKSLHHSILIALLFFSLFFFILRPLNLHLPRENCHLLYLNFSVNSV